MQLTALRTAADAGSLGGYFVQCIRRIKNGLIYKMLDVLYFNQKQKRSMPVIARFYGILIKMYFSQSEHVVPHFHAVYGEYNGIFSVEILEMIEGDLSVRSQRLVKEWGTQYQNELLRMWQNNEFKQLPGLE
jgi:hypothetical protein